MVPEIFNSSDIPIIYPKGQKVLYSKAGMAQMVRAHTVSHTQSMVGVPPMLACTSMWSKNA